MSHTKWEKWASCLTLTQQAVSSCFSMNETQKCRQKLKGLRGKEKKKRTRNQKGWFGRKILPKTLEDSKEINKNGLGVQYTTKGRKKTTGFRGILITSMTNTLGSQMREEQVRGRGRSWATSGENTGKAGNKWLQSHRKTK